MGDLVWVGTSEGSQFVVEEVTDELDIPWGMAFLSSDSMLVTEREGVVKLVNINQGTSKKIELPTDVFVARECGLLDVAVRDGYEADGWIYFTYSKLVDQYGYVALAKARLKDQVLIDWVDILITESERSNSGLHCGSRIAFDNNGNILFSVGDRGNRENAQNLKTHTGAILRVDNEGEPVKTNPFYLSEQVLPEIYSFGHRNPQGLAYDKNLNRIWSSEHGPRGGDELNLIFAGNNYGWPIITYGKEYHGPIIGEGTEKIGMTGPIKIIPPTFAPGSLLFYDGNKFESWEGNLFVGGLAGQKVMRYVLDSTGRILYEETLLEQIHERIRNIKQSPDGLIYISTDLGRILKIRPFDDDEYEKFSIFKHLDSPGFLVSMEFEIFYSY